MSSSEREQQWENRRIYKSQYSFATDRELDNLFPLTKTTSSTATPAPTPAPAPAPPVPTGLAKQRSKRGKNGGFGDNKPTEPPSPPSSPPKAPQPAPAPRNPAPTPAPVPPASQPQPPRRQASSSASFSGLSCAKLAEAERIRQQSIRGLVTQYLRQYPSIDTTHADAIYKDSCKGDVYPVVADMMRLKSNTAKHFEEAFAYYPWLAAHEPAPDEDPTKRTLLHYACYYGRPDVLKLLLDKKYKVRIGAQDEKGYSILHHAAKGGNLECLTLAHAEGAAYLEARDSEGRTPLMVAAFFNQKEVVMRLLGLGANIAAQDFSGATALDIAKKQGHLVLMNAVKALQEKETAMLARDNALKRWLAHPLRSKLYKAWMASPVPHTPVAVEGYIFSTTPAHKVEADNIELVRMNRYDVSSAQRNYFAQAQRHNALFLTLAYLGSPSICSPSDCAKTLAQYEEYLKFPVGPLEVHPLYFLACLRSVKDDLPLRKALLTDFVDKYPTSLGLTVEQGGWLTIQEEEELNTEFTAKKTADAPPETLREKWTKFADSAKLTQAQREPMDELMELTGLASVKELAIDLYIEAQENNFAAPDPKATAKEYNFAFLGNPGTGKTTVARILSKILEATGLRAGHKVIEMTASDALRKGVTQFSNEIAALTGGDSSIAPPAHQTVFRKGMNVEVKHGGKWFPAMVIKVVKTQRQKPAPAGQPAPKPGQPAPAPEFETVGTYDLRYPDGTEDTDMSMFEGKDQIIRVVSKETAAGGVLFLDEAYDLNPADNRDGRHIMADIMKVAEDCRDKVSIILAGYKDDIENKLYAYNSGMRDRFRSIMFEDFDENELLEVWDGMCKKAGWTTANMPGQMSVSRVAARRLAQRRSVKGFANARSVRVLCNQSITAAKRRPNNNKTLIVEDVVGVPPTPERIPALHLALQQLHEHIGIKQVKDAVASICDVARKNYEKELNGMKTDRIPLNRLFLGNPGTGKTTIASIYGQILKNLQLLSKGDVIERKASDFIGAVIGGTEEKTKGILSLAKGCVLIIDEAYNLNDQHFGKIALNTIVENVNNAPGDDIAVIMIGYEKNMIKMLDDQNPGLRSRFDPTYAFRFEDFSDLELLQIFSAACAKDQLDVPIDIKVAAVKHLAKARCMKNFGNARVVMTLLGAAKSRMNSRIQKDPNQPQTMTLEDVLGENAELKANPLQCIEELQGGEDEHGFRTVLRQLGNSINICRLENRPVDPVGNFIFTGAPGTGKTTVASKMAKMLNAFGVLASDHVVVTTALDLTGEYIGQSKKVIEGKMEEARGGVLFIDEAYKLGEGSYGSEVMVKLLGMLTEPEYNNGKTIVILGGYGEDMQRMLSRNAGMASRFNERIHFSNWSSEQCADLVETMGKKEQPMPFHFQGEVRSILLEGFRKLLPRPNWANARDSESMYKYLKKSRDRRRSQELNGGTGLAPKMSDAALYFTEEDAIQAVKNFLDSRPAATPYDPYDLNNYPRRVPDPRGSGPPLPAPKEASNDRDAGPPPAFATATAAATRQAPPPARPTQAEEEKKSDEEDSGEDSDGEEKKDSGDSDNDGDSEDPDNLTPEQIAELQRKQAAYEAECVANEAELQALLAEKAAKEAEYARLRQEAEAEEARLRALFEAEQRRMEEEKKAALAEMERQEELRRQERARELERIRLAHEEALRKAEAARRAELERQQAAERKRLQEAEEARKQAQLEEQRRKQREFEEAERERAAQEQKRKREEAKRLLREKKLQEEEQARIRAREEELNRKKLEQRKQEAIRTLGRCSAGFAWGKVSGGYRCCGNGHFIPDNEVERRCRELFG